jgi:hypothetical protein
MPDYLTVLLHCLNLCKMRHPAPSPGDVMLQHKQPSGEWHDIGPDDVQQRAAGGQQAQAMGCSAAQQGQQGAGQGSTPGGVTLQPLQQTRSKERGCSVR